MARAVYLLLVARGCVAAKQETGTGSHRPRFNMLLKDFIRHSKHLLQFADAQSQQLVRTLANRERPLMPYGITSYCPMISSKIFLANASDATLLLHHGMLSYQGTFKSRSVPPTKLRLGKFRAPKFTPWDHIKPDSWLPDYAARHLSSLTNADFGFTVPDATQEQRYVLWTGGGLH